MLFCILCTDGPGSPAARAQRRGAHLDYLNALGPQLAAAGATMSDDGATMTGSLLIVDMPDREAADAWVRNEPFNKAGVFERVEVRRWRKAFFNPPKD